MEVFEGRPADLTGRLEKERESYDLLESQRNGENPSSDFLR